MPLVAVVVVAPPEVVVAVAVAVAPVVVAPPVIVTAAWCSFGRDGGEDMRDGWKPGAEWLGKLR